MVQIKITQIIGEWQYTQNVYDSPDCSETSRIYQLIYTGTYQLTGKKSEYVEDFWHINYGFYDKDIRVFSAQYRNYLTQESSCGLGELVLGRTTNIENVHCGVLNITPSRDVCISFKTICNFRNID